MLGEVEAERLVRPERARPGDALLLTKAIAIEGTAVLAREAPDRLRAAGITNGVIERAAEFITEPGISVVREARAACAASLPHAMHDPTEGGIATALYELSAACDTGVEVDRKAISVTPETVAVCGALSLDPLGLLASGSLLLVCAADEAGEVIQSIEETGVPARQIGSLTAPEDGVIMLVNGERTAVPRFERDEVARFLSEQAG